jgi:hypothetical protein
LWRLAQQSSISIGCVWTATKLLHIHPYKITVVPEIEPMDYEKRVRLCNWFINHVHDGFLNQYFMKELLILNDTLMKYTIHFSLIWHLEKKDSVFLCKTA